MIMTQCPKTGSARQDSLFRSDDDAGPQSASPAMILCIPCAVGSAEFKERAPHPAPGFHSDGPSGRAWIDGRSFELLRHTRLKIACERCGQVTPVVYTCDNEEAA